MSEGGEDPQPNSDIHSRFPVGFTSLRICARLRPQVLQCPQQRPQHFGLTITYTTLHSHHSHKICWSRTCQYKWPHSCCN